MRHRIANSLQLIASILILKAGSVTSEESKMHLQDAHDRIISLLRPFRRTWTLPEALPKYPSSSISIPCAKV